MQRDNCGEVEGECISSHRRKWLWQATAEAFAAASAWAACFDTATEPHEYFDLAAFLHSDDDAYERDSWWARRTPPLARLTTKIDTISA
jgi:hypothetical protein